MSEEKVSLSERPRSPEPGETGYVPPAAAVPLPSQGLIYPENSPLAGKEVLEIRAMTARDEDILTSRALIKQGKVLDALLRACVVDRDVDTDAMLSGDRNAALIAIRITGYGSQYKAAVACPKCAEESEYEFDLAALPIKRLGQTPDKPHQNEFSYVLPVSQANVVFKLFTGADERELSVVLDRSKKASGGIMENLVTTRLLHQIVSLNGERDKARLASVIRNIPARDSRALRTHMDEIVPGVDMKQAFDCPQCGERSEVEVPTGTELFWPKA